MPSVCHSEADCTNTEGSFTCTCKSGYTGNGQLCTGMTDVFLKQMGSYQQIFIYRRLIDELPRVTHKAVMCPNFNI